ncbi:NAD(P)/FAD-dependent oxidoreductase [Candidatus Woesearchaeota archaeon]|nr:NAD(P)/FAD-dependent oxidoreductase [Candidatus Woesearchaeota archaeon]
MINIIGAGPVGCYAAYLLSKAGENVRVFEEHSAIGSPVQCTGLVTSQISELVTLKKDVVVNKIKKARIHSGKNSFEARISDTVIDRKKFDQSLAKKALKSGCEFFFNYRFLGINNRNLVFKNLKNKKIRKIAIDKTDSLIGADGPNSVVRDYVGKMNRINHLMGIQARAKLKDEGNIFEVWLDKAPDFFGWAVPENEGIVRIGLAARKNPNSHFQKFLESRKIRKKDIIELQGGLIPIYDPELKVQKSNIYLVGDAAGHVKATTGGGIVPGLIGAECLVDSILHNKDYQRLLNKRINLKLLAHLKLRNILNNFSESDLNKLIKLCSQNKIKKTLGTVGRDNPIKLLTVLAIKEPRFLFFLKNALKGWH